MQCIFARAHSQQEGKRPNAKTPAVFPVPLWPTYALDGAPSDKEGATWLILGHAEAWIANIAALSTPPASQTGNGKRHLIAGLRNLWVPRFQNALKDARALIHAEEPGHDDQDAPSEDPLECVPTSTVLTFSKHVSFDVTIEGHTMTALNSLRPVVIQLDDRATAFLHTAFAAKAPVILRNVLKVSTGSQATPVAPFHFTPDLLRNIRGKVVWL